MSVLYYILQNNNFKKSIIYIYIFLSVNIIGNVKCIKHICKLHVHDVYVVNRHNININELRRYFKHNNLPYLLMTFALLKKQTGHDSDLNVKTNGPF